MKDEKIFGIHPVLEALQSRKTIEKIFIQKNLRSEQIHELRQLCKEQQVMMQYVPVEKLNRLTGGNHQGVVALLSPITYTKVEDLIPFLYEQGDDPFILILDRITDIRNVGAMARSLECAGANGLILSKKHTALINAEAIKSSAGALIKIPVCREDRLENTVRFLKESGIKIIACHEHGENLHFESDMKGPLALVMGSEEDGISPSILKLCDEGIRIPMRGTTASLNVSVATGIVLFEASRQRNH